MPTFRLRVAWRDVRGLVRTPVHDRTIEASSLREAVGAVLSEPDSLLVDDANLAWLTDMQENLVWTLRLDDHNAEAT